MSGCAPPVAPPPLAQPVVSPREKARQSLGLTARETRLEFRTQPQSMVAQVPALWSLKVLETRRKQDGKSDYVRSFTPDHSQLMHLIVVSRDLSFFKHLKPDYKDYGHFLIETTLPLAGRYQLFADYTPHKGREEVARQQLVVAPASSAASSAAPAPASSNDAPVASMASSTNANSVFRADVMKNNRIIKQIAPVGKSAPSATALNETVSGETVSSYGARGQVTLALGGSATRNKTSRSVVSGRETTLRFQLRDYNGFALADSDLDDAASQCFIVSGDGAIFLHPRSIVQKSKAQKNAAEIDFPVRFPASGLYKIWFEFYLRDELLVAPFVLNVVAPQAPAA